MWQGRAHPHVGLNSRTEAEVLQRSGKGHLPWRGAGLRVGKGMEPTFHWLLNSACWEQKGAQDCLGRVVLAGRGGSLSHRPLAPAPSFPCPCYLWLGQESLTLAPPQACPRPQLSLSQPPSGLCLFWPQGGEMALMPPPFPYPSPNSQTLPQETKQGHHPWPLQPCS